MNSKFIVIFLSLFIGANALADSVPAIPKPLVIQVEHLTALLSDGTAVGYPNATHMQNLHLRENYEVTLAVFTVEGFGGGNNHTQFLAAFEANLDKNNAQHYTLLDVIPIAGKGWRAVYEMNAKFQKQDNARETIITIDSLDLDKDDGPNFPTIKSTITLSLKDGRLMELHKQ